MTTAEELDEWFDHHPPTPNKIIQHETVRAGAKHYAAQLLLAVPPGVERENALSFLRTAAMWANAGIACLAERPLRPADAHAPDCPGCAAAAEHGQADADG
jgi:hypothetical protein